jgi:competence protein ComEA
MFRRLVREYLSLTHIERRGFQFMGFLLLLLLLIRGSLPLLIHPRDCGTTIPGEDFTAFRDSLQKLDTLMAAANKSRVTGREPFPSDAEPFPSDAEPFPFDPNTAGFDELVRLGLTPGTARILLNYRKAGGSFGSDSDLLKVYGLHPDEFRRLQPYIRMNPRGYGSPHKPDTAFSTYPNAMLTTSTLSRTDQPYTKGTSLSFELNRADSLQLVSVFGIGPVFARRIIQYRQMLGGFCRPEQLMEVYGLNMQQYEELMRCSYLDTSLLRKINLNRMDAATLSLHPYLDRYQARSLVAYREAMGAFRDPLEVLDNGLLPDSIYRRIRPYLEVHR